MVDFKILKLRRDHTAMTSINDSLQFNLNQFSFKIWEIKEYHHINKILDTIKMIAKVAKNHAQSSDKNNYAFNKESTFSTAVLSPTGLLYSSWQTLWDNLKSEYNTWKF